MGRATIPIIVLALSLAATPSSAQQAKKAKAAKAADAQAQQIAPQNAAPEVAAPAAPDPDATEGGSEAATPDGGGRNTSLEARVLLKVVNPDDARAALLEKVGALGGFPMLVEDASLVLKVPPEKLSLVLGLVADQGLVVEKSLERADLTQEIARLRGQLRSKREMIGRLRGFFDDSNTEATLRIEQTMTSIVAEIEQIKGQLRVAEERSRWALVRISFEFRERDRIVYVSSPFEWLNTVSLSRFLEEF